MAIKTIYLDSSSREENITLILGKNILLKIIEDLEKQTLLKNKKVQKFVAITDLCHDDLRALIEELIKTESSLFASSDFMKSLLVTAESKDIERLTKLSTFFQSSILNSKLAKTFEKSARETAKQLFEELSPQETEAFTSEVMHIIMGRIDEKLVQDENKKMMAISDKIKEKTNFEILTPSNFLLCPKCRIILSTEEFKGIRKCYVCGKDVKRENAERVYTYKVFDEIKKVWKTNLWFEEYMAKLLRRLDCKTWTGVHVMGASGILHEIDVLAIRNGIVLACECKTGKVSRNDVFNFCTKVGDLKTHISILALINELPEPETREFIKKNPAIIRLENLGKRYQSEILDDLERRLLIKA